MADVQNDYNQREGDPVVRIGNWVEQRALLATTGHTRGALVHSSTGQLLPPNTHARTIQQLPTATPDWQSSTQHDWTDGLQGRQRDSAPLPCRADLRRADILRRAREVVEEQERQTRGEEEKAMYESLYGHRAPINRRRALGEGQGGGLDDLPITRHNDAQMKGGMRAEVAQQRAGRTSGLHGKNTDFSVPISHSKAGPHHHHGI